eukprot:1188222-Prorocentrum_minimum.AAC.2
MAFVVTDGVTDGATDGVTDGVTLVPEPKGSEPSPRMVCLLRQKRGQVRKSEFVERACVEGGAGHVET